MAAGSVGREISHAAAPGPWAHPQLQERGTRRPQGLRSAAVKDNLVVRLRELPHEASLDRHTSKRTCGSYAVSEILAPWGCLETDVPKGLPRKRLGLVFHRFG